MNIKNLSFQKISIIAIGFSLLLSTIGLGLAANYSVNSGNNISNIGDLSKDEADAAITFANYQKRYKNVTFLEKLRDVKELVNSKATFLLFTGPRVCFWCRISFDVDERVLAERGSEFEDGQPKGFITNASNAFRDSANGPINDQTLNEKFPFFAFEDLKSKTTTEYAQSAITKSLYNFLLGKLDDEEEIEFVMPIPFKNNSEVTVSRKYGGVTTSAADFRSFYNAYNDADEIKLRAGTEDLKKQKNDFLNSRTVPTPTFWAIIKGQPIFITSGFLTRKGLEGFASFFLSNNDTVDQLRAKLIS